MKVFGVVGWKNSGKTCLVECLVEVISSRGFSVSTIKHAHHTFDIDQVGKDSYRHRKAGAKEVILSSKNRWALMGELRGKPEPDLKSLIEKLDEVDLVLIEGFKSEGHLKIESHRIETGKSLISQEDNTIIAIASNSTVKVSNLPTFNLDDTTKIAEFILTKVGLR
jgi:molybdopterin molybdotransferase/molybdopterin-guanine dinucleotide biosynthesis protein B